MSTFIVERPNETEYLPYYSRYISLVPEGDIVTTLESQIKRTLELLHGISEERAGYRYEDGKWSVKEVIGHIIDAERIFAYRALRIARGDSTPLSGYEQDDYVAAGNFDSRTMADLAEELKHLRLANVRMFRGFDAGAWTRRGKANDAEISVRALAYSIAGHEIHHVNLLRNKYLNNAE
jgi:hypothetical protein